MFEFKINLIPRSTTDLQWTINVLSIFLWHEMFECVVLKSRFTINVECATLYDLQKYMDHFKWNRNKSKTIK